MKPVSPSPIASGIPAWSVPTAGRPEAAASTITVGRPSASPSRAVTLGAASSQPAASSPPLHRAAAAEKANPVAKPSPRAAAPARPQRPVADDDQRRFRHWRRREQQAVPFFSTSRPTWRIVPLAARAAANRAEVDADIVGERPLLRIALRDRLPPQRVRNGEEQLPLRISRSAPERSASRTAGPSRARGARR